MQINEQSHSWSSDCCNSNSELQIFPSPHGSWRDFELIPAFSLTLCVEDTAGPQNRWGDEYLII